MLQCATTRRPRITRGYLFWCGGASGVVRLWTHEPKPTTRSPKLVALSVLRSYEKKKCYWTLHFFNVVIVSNIKAKRTHSFDFHSFFLSLWHMQLTASQNCVSVHVLHSCHTASVLFSSLDSVERPNNKEFQMSASTDLSSGQDVHRCTLCMFWGWCQHPASLHLNNRRSTTIWVGKRAKIRIIFYLYWNQFSKARVLNRHTCLLLQNSNVLIKRKQVTIHNI